jgi:hypothetical protein
MRPNSAKREYNSAFTKSDAEKQINAEIKKNQDKLNSWWRPNKWIKNISKI